jgi:hypothetical protein
MAMITSLPMAFAPLSDQPAALFAVPEDRPHEGRPPVPRVGQPVARREERCHERLKEDTQRQRSTQPPEEVLQDAGEHIIHG